MTKEDIIRMAREAGWSVGGGFVMPTHAGHITHELERFAALVASAERRACIVDIQMHIPRSGRHTPEYQMAMRMIERIRARGQA